MILGCIEPGHFNLFQKNAQTKKWYLSGMANVTSGYGVRVSVLSGKQIQEGVLGGVST